MLHRYLYFYMRLSRLLEREGYIARSIDDDGIRAGYIYSRFDYRRAHQNVVTLVVKVRHDFFKFSFWHLAMGGTNSCLWDQLLQVLASTLNAFDFVMQEKNLAPLSSSRDTASLMTLS